MTSVAPTRDSLFISKATPGDDPFVLWLAPRLVLRSTGPLPPIEQILGDVLGLAKINYNACNFSDGLPVTIRFADKVGEILVQGSAAGHEKQPFKFYI